MSAILSAVTPSEPKLAATGTMKALIFRGVNNIGIEQVPIPRPGPGEAVIRVTLTTICGTDLHIVRGEYPVRPGLIIGHEPVGVIHELGVGVTGYKIGDRVLVGAITPCGQCNDCLRGDLSQCGGPIGGWRFGNTINGAQAEYVLVPFAQANLAPIPNDLRDEQVVLLADIASTGISAAESGNVQIGDAVAVFAQGPIGLCATAGAKLKGASLIIGVESDPVRARMARKMGAAVPSILRSSARRIVISAWAGRGPNNKGADARSAANHATAADRVCRVRSRMAMPGSLFSSAGLLPDTEG